MAETFLFNVAEKVLGKLGSNVAQEVSLAWGVKKEFTKLQDTISTIQAVLLDAEEKQANDRQLTDWLGKLKDALYDAEDLFDEFQYETLRSQVVNHGGIRRKVRNFFSRSYPLAFRLKMGHKIKEVSEKLDEIAAQKAKFHLTERYVDRRVMHGKREMTHSFVRASDVIGRDVDKEKIIRLLMHPDDRENVSIIPIVGIGGLGKTMLAKLVYNDEEVTRHFDLKMWVCVSEDFDVIRLAKEIYESAIGKYSSADDLIIDQLQTELRSTLNNKKYLLVMDDVWNDDLGKWVVLKELLLGGANGSKIVVTTRSQSVASIMGTTPAYNLKGLPHEDCMSLFVEWAFKKGEDKQHSNLLKIGDQIVKKCGGVPLAVRTLGSLLYLKIEERDWLTIRDNNIWKFEQKENYILPALRLSYDQMPSYLKKCFAFCSIFPEGYEFTNFQLIQIWMAQGLLWSSTVDQDLEAIGQHYIQELLSRSFFQEVKEEGPFFTFKMHVLMHDLALFVMGSNICTINSGTSFISESVRHLLFSENDFSINEVSRSSSFQLNHVWTISFPIEGVGPTSVSFVETCISRFKYLRMLDLSDSCLELLPSSIGELKHLRYLDLSHSRTLKKLPDSIYDLPNLQTLRLLGCLELEELPTGKGNFIRLRSLSLTTKQMCLPEKKIGGLLRFLEIGECVNVKSLGGVMRHLTALRILAISGCESLKRLPHVMQYLSALETLHIYNCQKLDLMKWREDISGLKLSLQSVSIGQLQQSTVLPPWLRAAAKTLEQIRIEDCPNLIALPEWLPSLVLLKKLEIINCPELVALPAGMQSLTELTVKIEDCPKLRRASKRETGKQFSKITFLEEASEVVEIIRSRGNFVVSKREIDSTSKSSRSVEGSWWNLDLF